MPNGDGQPTQHHRHLCLRRFVLQPGLRLQQPSLQPLRQLATELPRRHTLRWRRPLQQRPLPGLVRRRGDQVLGRPTQGRCHWYLLRCRRSDPSRHHQRFDQPLASSSSAQAHAAAGGDIRCLARPSRNAPSTSSAVRSALDGPMGQWAKPSRVLRSRRRASTAVFRAV